MSGLAGSFSWLCLAAFARSIPSTVACITAAAAATAFSDVVADSIVVELARASPGATEGALQSLCWGAHAFGRVITAYLSGWLVDRVGPQMVFVITATFPLIVCVSSCLINEKRLGTAVQDQQAAASQDTASILQDNHISGPSSSVNAVKSQEVPQYVEVLTGVHPNDHPHLNHRGSFNRGDQQEQQTGSTAAALSRVNSGDSNQHIHGGSGRLPHLWRQLFGGVAASVSLFWRAVKQPHVLRPVVFLFLWQVST